MHITPLRMDSLQDKRQIYQRLNMESPIRQWLEVRDPLFIVVTSPATSFTSTDLDYIPCGKSK